ncbi:unknown [Prevotella sp. CAG:5226]|nr:unknown [Prevotella sp. CAG:5226]
MSKFAIYTIHTISLSVIYIKDICIFCIEQFPCYCYYINASCLSKFAIYTIHAIPLPVIYIRDISIFCFEQFSCYCYYINN